MERDFKGVWIPREIYSNKELSWTEKILFIEIDSLDNEKGCFASNPYFAEFLDVSETRVSKMISKLKSLGYIYQESFNGRDRILHSNIKICKADLNKSSKQDGTKVQSSTEEKFKHNNITNNTVNNTDIDTFFQKIWTSYPLKKGKGEVSLSQKKKLYKLGEEVILKCISRYVKEMEGREQFLKHGSTFFNSGYIDYLDENYQEVKSKPVEDGYNGREFKFD